MGRQADDHSDLDLPNMRISSSSAVPPVICRPGLGWSQCVHPEGWVYFQKGNIVTDVAPDRLPEVEGHIATFARVLTNDQYDISVSSSPSNAALNIFFVNHELRYASSNMRDVTESPGLPASQDIRMEYWKFMCHYPSHRPLPLGALAMARQLLDCYIMDGLRRRSESHAPFRLEQSKELLEFLDKMGGTSDDSDIFMTTTAASGIPSRSSSLVALVSWIMLTSGMSYHLKDYVKLGCPTLSSPQLVTVNYINTADAHSILSGLIWPGSLSAFRLSRLYALALHEATSIAQAWH
ncbi:hypothetical protein OE88DRAFT_1738366 [Heliocybe sulcata]|uniref:Uncharacterized protein n=1 Tax=Heliocybe sulcata TaxID=5364 RepID=A0A5C3MS39_9AGAM|nr:hypothetical protein OE88DRAFT_1738366 [Heliocybe sulcata]